MRLISLAARHFYKDDNIEYLFSRFLRNVREAWDKINIDEYYYDTRGCFIEIEVKFSFGTEIMVPTMKVPVFKFNQQKERRYQQTTYKFKITNL